MILSAPKVEVRMVPLRDIKVDQSFNPRVGGTNKDTAAEYAADMQKGHEFPPGVVYEDRQRVLWLSEGFTRYEACGIADLPSMRCEIRQGDRRDAALNAAGSNGNHGQRRTTDDIQKACEIVLSLEPGWTDRRVAEVARVTPPTVARARERMAARDPSNEKVLQCPRVASDGRTFQPPAREKLPAVAPPPDDDEIPPPDPKVDFEADVQVVCIKLAEHRMGLEECRAEIERLSYTAFGGTIGHKKALAMLDEIDLAEVARLVWSPRKGEPPTG